MHGKLVVLGLLTLSTSVLVAQGGGAGGRAGARRMPGGPPPGGDSMAGNRAMLEQRVQQRLAQTMRQQLGLTEPQMKKVQETNRKFEGKRRILMDQERDIRMSLRDEMARPDSARQGQVGSLLDRMTTLQRQRLDILDAEQKELGAFLTPVQRAQYMAIEERVRQRMQQMRQEQMGGDGMQPGRMGGMRGRMGNQPPDDGGMPPNGRQPLRRRPLGPPPVDSGAI